MSEFSIRPKHETPEKKEARKKRREKKKANSLGFKSKKNRQDKIDINMKNNMQGIKILTLILTFIEIKLPFF